MLMFSRSRISLFSAFVLASFLVNSPTAEARQSVEDWVGVIKDPDGFHEQTHTINHPLNFIRDSDGKSFLIVGGGESLVEEHVSADKTLRVRLSGETTSKFLVFGGNLVLRKAEVLEKLASVAHRSRARIDSSDRPYGRMGR